MRKLRSNVKRNRRAAAMALALVVLLVVGTVSGLSLRAILRSHRQVREEEQRVQAELLADSALSRAAAMLNANPTWTGESWKVSLADSAEAATSGIAVIRVEKGAEPGRRQISITAIYPEDPGEPENRAQAVREISYSISQPGDNK